MERQRPPSCAKLGARLRLDPLFSYSIGFVVAAMVGLVFPPTRVVFEMAQSPRLQKLGLAVYLIGAVAIFLLTFWMSVEYSQRTTPINPNDTYELQGAVGGLVLGLAFGRLISPRLIPSRGFVF